LGAQSFYQLLISQQPQSQDVPLGSNATLTVQASGFGPSAYQWTFDGNRMAGATGSSLVLTNVQFTNAGLYSVVVSNAAGTLTSMPATLNVLPNLIIQPVTNGLILSWSGPFILQSALVVTGPYQDVPGATSPYFQSTIGQPQMFFRLRSSDFSLAISRSSGSGTVLTMTGPPGANFILQASDDLLNWANVLTNTAPCTWADPAAPQHPNRMYRLRLAPIAPNPVPLLSTPILQIQASWYEMDNLLCPPGNAAGPLWAEASPKDVEAFVLVQASSRVTDGELSPPGPRVDSGQPSFRRS
jgi:hypothetical protein